MTIRAERLAPRTYRLSGDGKTASLMTPANPDGLRDKDIERVRSAALHRAHQIVPQDSRAAPKAAEEVVALAIADAVLPE